KISLLLPVGRILTGLLFLIGIFGTYPTFAQVACTTPPPPTVSSPITYCQNQTAIPLAASGSNLIWGGSLVSGSVGGSSTLTSGVYVDPTASNNRRTN